MDHSDYCNSDYYVRTRSADPSLEDVYRAEIVRLSEENVHLRTTLGLVRKVLADTVGNIELV